MDYTTLATDLLPSILIVPFFSKDLYEILVRRTRMKEQRQMAFLC